MKKKDLIVIIIFIAFLFIPTILYWFVQDKMDNTNYENRVLATKPVLTFKEITNYPTNYENYYNDNLPFKNDIRKIRSKILYKLLGISADSRVIIGKDGWFFFTGDSTISDYSKTTRYTNDEKNTIADSLLKTKKELEKKNIDFYIYIAPNKENVYSEKLKGIIKKTDNKYSKVEDLIDYLNKKTDLKIIYPKKELLKNKKNNSVYYKYDTHWNEYGAYIGATELLKTIDSNFESPNIKMKFHNSSGDLANMNLSNQLNNKEPSVKNFYDNIEYTCNNDSSYCESNNPLYDKTIMIIGDSFRMGMVPYIAKTYKKSMFIHRDYYNKDYIEKYNPDIIVYEVVERYSFALNNSSMLY